MAELSSAQLCCVTDSRTDRSFVVCAQLTCLFVFTLSNEVTWLQRFKISNCKPRTDFDQIRCSSVFGFVCIGFAWLRNSRLSVCFGFGLLFCFCRCRCRCRCLSFVFVFDAKLSLTTTLRHSSEQIAQCKLFLLP